MRRSKWLAIVVFAFGALAAEAQTYPVKPVHFIVPFASGTAPDVVARLVGERLGSTWRQPVIVENRPGAIYADKILKGAKAGELPIEQLQR